MPALKLKDKDGNWIPLPTIKGADGKSAYQQAVEAGYTGTEAAFYAALVSLKDGPFLPLSGGTMIGPLEVQTPTAGKNAANKGYVDDGLAAKAAASHTHGAGDITSGTLNAARLPTVPLNKGGTGATTAAAARSNLGACAAFGPVVATVSVGSWSGSGPWTQTVSVAGVTAADNGIGVYPVDVADGDARKLYEAAYGCLAAEAETVAGGVKLTCREKKPETSFQVKIQGVR